MPSNFTYFTCHHNLIEHGQIVSIFWRLTGNVFSTSFLMNPVSNAVLISIESGFCKSQSGFF